MKLRLIVIYFQKLLINFVLTVSHHKYVNDYIYVYPLKLIKKKALIKVNIIADNRPTF